MFVGKMMVLFWFLIGLVLALAELALPGFVVIFFAIGAWMVMLLVFAGLLPSFNGQMLVFLIISIATLILFRKKSKTIFEGKVAGQGQAVDEIAGEKAMVMQDIRPDQIGGKVELHGTLWEAVADEVIERGRLVEIVERNNLTLRVKAL